MENMQLGNSDLYVSRIALGCMRMAAKTKENAAEVLKAALEGEINFFDHADIYAAGESEVRFREALSLLGVNRQSIYLQSKCGIKPNSYDLSYEHIINAVEGSLKRLGTDYLDVLLLHRPDALLEPADIARAFSDLKTAGKVRWFGVSNHSPSKLELAFCEVTVQTRPVVDQLQISLDHAEFFTTDFNLNRSESFGADHSGYVLDYCQKNQITVQAWSPLQYSTREGSYIGSPEHRELNAKLDQLAQQYGVAPETIAIAWLLRHPARIQPIIGTMSPDRITNICRGVDISLTRRDWYDLYLAGGNFLP